ncbi:hypothetical protein OG494_11100 [Amycolatopsis sp. NBC_00438]
MRVIAPQLRDVLDVTAVRHRRGEAHVRFHQEVRAGLDVEGFGQVGHLEPGRDAAGPGDVGLHDRGRAAVQVVAELRDE